MESVSDVPIPVQTRIFGSQHAASLDMVNLAEMFSTRARVMQFVPWVFRGAFRTAVRVAMQEILEGTEANSELRATRGWKQRFTAETAVIGAEDDSVQIPWRRQCSSQTVGITDRGIP